MKIPKQLPQFSGETTLVAVTGSHRANFYLATNGVISLAASIEVKNPKYSDREGFFESRGNGRTYGSGSVYEAKKQKIIVDFLHIFRKTLKYLAYSRQPVHMYIFTPQYLSHSLIRQIPNPLKRKVRGVIAGNFSHNGLLYILKKIQPQSTAQDTFFPAPGSLKKYRLYKKTQRAGRITS